MIDLFFDFVYFAFVIVICLSHSIIVQIKWYVKNLIMFFEENFLYFLSEIPNVIFLCSKYYIFRTICLFDYIMLTM